MYSIRSTKTYHRSYKRVFKQKNFYPAPLDQVIDILAQGKKLEERFRDHQLSGKMKDYRECHVKGDLLLVYQIRKSELILVLIDIGTHSYLGL